MPKFTEKVCNFFKDKRVQVAIIGFVGAIAASLILVFGPILSEKNGHGNLETLSKDWQKALNGTWVGTEIQEEGLGDSPVEFDAELTLRAGKKLITGEYKVACREDRYKDMIAEFEVSGGFPHRHRHERCIKLDYENTDDSVQQFGTILLLWSPTGKELNGRIVGFSATYGVIAPGTVQLRKREP